MSNKNEIKPDCKIVLAKCPKCGKFTPHELYEYYVDDDTADEPTIRVEHYKCLNCGYESEIEININNLDCLEDEW